MAVGSTSNARSAAYAMLNIVSASGIVFANKAVLSTFGFHFIYSLTLIHTLTTLAGMKAFQAAGIYEKKLLPKRALAPLAAAYVGYIVLNNLNLQLNTVGFYQITKIAVAPAVLLAEAVFLGKRSSRAVTASIGVVCAGVALATVTDPQLIHAGGGGGAGGSGGGGGALVGLLVGAGAIAATTAYQIWAGTKQRELGAGSMQLLDQYAPLAAGMLSGLVLLREPLGRPGTVPPDPDTLLGYPYSVAAVAAIAVSAALGLLVSLSTFLVIGATSSLTYNVVGHVKTVIILAGGCLFFGDEMPPKKLAGISLAFAGIVWYSQLKMAEAAAASSAVGSGGSETARERERGSETIPLTNKPPASPKTVGLVGVGKDARA